MRRILIVAAIIFVVAIAVFASLRIYKNKNMVKAPSTSELKEKMGTPVETIKAQLGEIDSKLAIYGMLKGENEVPIYPKLGGRALRITVDNGDRVRAGQLLVEIEAKEVMDGVRQAEAAVRGANEQVKLVHKGARPQERIQVENLVVQAKQAFDIAQSNLSRMETLLKAGVVSQQQYDSMKLNYDMAKTQYDNAKEQLSIVQVGARDEERGMAEEGKKQAEAALALAKQQLSNALVTAPVSGVVSSRIIDPGTLVGPTMQYPMMTIVDDSSFSMQADISEVDLDKVRLGQDVELTIDAIPGKKFSGRISEINPAVSYGTRTYTVKVVVENKDGLMKSGMFARGQITVASSKDIIKLPKDSLVKQTDGSFVVFVIKDGKAVLKKVKTGIQNTVTTEVSEGVAAGDEVIVVGASGLKDGEKVNVIKTGIMQDEAK